MGGGEDHKIAIPLGILIGLPGSGKSTWAGQFVTAHPDYQIVSTDDIRASLYGDAASQGDWLQIWAQVLAAWHQGVAAILQGDLAGILYDATNTRRRHRREAILAARRLGFTHITFYWFDVSLSTALERNRLRSRQVPGAVIERMHRQLQAAPPSLAEGVDQVVRR